MKKIPANDSLTRPIKKKVRVPLFYPATAQHRAPAGQKLQSGVFADAQKDRPRLRRRDRDQTLRVARSTATAGKIFDCLPHFCRFAFSVHELRHVAGQIVLIALAPRQQIDARRQPVHVDVRICGRVAPRVGDAKQVAVRIVSKPSGPV